MERADKLTEPPIVGRYYLVPAIPWKRKAPYGVDHNDSDLWWPVIGPRHNDLEFFNFEHLHFHVDPRFLSKRHWQFVFDDGRGGKLFSVLATPLSGVNMPKGPRDPKLRKMCCSMDTVPSPEWIAGSKQVIDLNRTFAGKQCARGKRGWVCPHRKIALGSVTPIDGVITCFLHGLRIDAETGRCLGSAPSANAP